LFIQQHRKHFELIKIIFLEILEDHNIAYQFRQS